MGSIITQIQLADNSITDLAKATKGLSMADTALAIDLGHVDEGLLGNILTTNGYTEAEIRATSATKADTVAKTANLSVTNSLRVAWAKLTAFMAANPVLMGLIAVSAAVYATVKVVDYFTESVEEAKETANTFADEWLSLKSDVESTNSELATTGKRIDELNTKDNLSFVEQTELQNLKNTNAELERTLVLQTALEKVANDEARDSAKNYFNKKDEYGRYTGFDMSDVDAGNSRYGQSRFEIFSGSQLEIAEQQLNDYEALSIRKKELDEQIGDFKVQNLNNYEDSDTYQNMAMELSQVDQQMGMLKANIAANVQEFDKLDNSLSLDEDGSYIQFIGNIYDAFSRLFDGDNYKQKKFDSAFNAEDFATQKEQLLELSKAGELSPDVLTSNKDYNRLLAEIGATAEDVVSQINSMSEEGKKLATNTSFADLLSSLPLDKLEEYIALLNSGKMDAKTISSYSDLAEILKESGLSEEDAIKKLKEFSEGFVLSSDLISGIQEVYDLLNKAKDDIGEYKEISLDTLKSIASSYPQLQDEVTAYTQGLITAEEMYSSLESAYYDSADAFRQAMSNKLSTNEDFFSSVVSSNEGLFTKMSKAYDVDVRNWKTLAQAKAEIDQKLIRSLSNGWSEYYGIQYDATSGLASVTGNTVKHGSSQGVAMDKEQLDAYQKVLKQTTAYNEAMRRLNEAAKIEIVTPDFNGIGDDKTKSKSKSESKSKSKEESSTDFDWITRGYEILQKYHDKAQQLLNDESVSYETQISLIDELITKSKERLTFIENADASYKQYWKDAKDNILQEASKQGEDGNKLISQIMNGDTKNIELSGDLAKYVSAGVGAYDELIQNQERSAGLSKEINEHLSMQLQKKLAIVQAQTQLVSTQSDSLDAEIKLMEASGLAVTENQLKKQVGYSDELISKYYDEIDALKEILQGQEEGSAEYYNTLSSISQCESAIANCELNQAEWNEQIKRLPIERIGKFLELLGFVKQDLENLMSQQSALGISGNKDQYQQLIDISQMEIDKLLEQQDKLKELLKTYEYGSKKYQDVQGELQAIDNTISGLIQSQHEWNKAILQIPIDSLNKVNDTLNSALSAMNNVLSDYDAAISAVTGALDKEIKSINDLKEATDKAYKDKIDPLQKELDLLQKQNKERQILLGLEQAEYNLDRAKNQKTTATIRNGETVYESDIDDLRNAQKEKQEAEYNKVVNDLQNQIELLEKERDVILEGYDKQIEKLGEIKDHWSSIKQDAEDAANAFKADSILGEGWKGDILSGNGDKLLGNIKDLYTTISSQKNQYEEQIKSNERIAEMMSQFMEKWMAGSITYEEAMTGIRKMAESMKDGFGSLDHLDSLLGVNGFDDLNSMLEGLKESSNASVAQFEGYMEVVKANSGSIDKYNSSWKEMQQNIKDQISALEKLANEATKVATSINKYMSSGGGSTPGKDPGYVNSGPGVKYHSGLEEGFVGSNSSPDKNSKLKLLGLRKLKPDEIAAILQKSEVVLTPEQQHNAIHNIGAAWKFSPNAPNYSVASVNRRNEIPNVTLQMGDIKMDNVQDPDGFAKALFREAEPVLRQQFSKIFKE